MSSIINLKKEKISDKDFDHLDDSHINEYKELSYKYFQFRTYRLRGSNGHYVCPFCNYRVEHQNNQYKHILFHAIQVGESSESGKQKANHLAMAKNIVIDLADDVKGEMDAMNVDVMQGEMDAADRIRHLERELNETRDEMNDLITKECQSNDELQGACSELIKGLNDFLRGKNNNNIGLKNLGEIDSEAFISEMEKRCFSIDCAVIKGVEFWSLWQEKLKDSQWYPYQIIEDENGKPRRLLKEEDESLQELKKEWGQDVHDAVVVAMNERHEYDPSGCYVVPELWNFKESRKAKLDEVISYILEALVKDVAEAVPQSTRSSSASKSGEDIVFVKEKRKLDTSREDLEQKRQRVDDEQRKEMTLKNLLKENEDLNRSNQNLLARERKSNAELQVLLKENEDLKHSNQNLLAREQKSNPDLQVLLKENEDLKHSNQNLLARAQKSNPDLQVLLKENEDLKHSNQNLLAREQKSKAELQGARRELIKGLNYWQSGNINKSGIGIKYMGEIDEDIIKRACSKRFQGSEADIAAKALCSARQEKLENTEWCPYQMVEDDNGKLEMVVEEDDSLRSLKNVWGNEIYSAVMTALKDLCENNPRRQHIFSEIWNLKENRKAKLEEAISYALAQSKEKNMRL